MPDPSLSVRSQEQERQERADDRKTELQFTGLSNRASRSRTQQPAQAQEDAAADEESEEIDKGGAAVLLGHLLIRSE